MQIFTELLSYAFRPFFLLGSLCTILVMVLWIMALAGAGPIATHVNPMLWHAHEMLFGFAMAIVAGFVMTAVAMWTGRTRLHGAPLGLLVAAWIIGRVAMALGGSLPVGLIASLDLLFPVLLSFFFAREVIAAGNRRNLIIVGIIVAIAMLDVLYHVGAAGSQAGTGLDRTALLLMIHVVLLLITAIAGRIVPNFTAGWLRGQGRLQEDNAPRSTPAVEAATLVLTIITGCAATFAPASPVTGIVALAAAAMHAFRLSRWNGLATRSEPLLFMLHIAYLWLPIGYVLIAWSAFQSVYPASVALHALTMGGIGSIILAMTTRVGLGHTGRILQAARLTVVAYVVLTLAVIIRLLGPLIGAQYMRTVELAAGGWIAAFVIFIWVYWPILTQPRADA
ncbi:MAG: hypothetical protein DRR11_18325 [Gammaproteobacteria bacterium]|nr:MAG: hypothetical protein DRR11_18325 [Gammaproteobacteria bacterium]